MKMITSDTNAFEPFEADLQGTEWISEDTVNEVTHITVGMSADEFCRTYSFDVGDFHKVGANMQDCVNDCLKRGREAVKNEVA